MIDVTRKFDTLRTAIAEAVVRTDAAAIDAIQKKAVPKGDLIETVRVAGMLAAKKTSELLPHCHNLPLDAVAVTISTENLKVVIRAEVKTVGKTGVEMEALTAVSVAALTAYDMLKPITNELEIERVRLLEKHGGKSDFRDECAQPLRAAVIVTSDGTFAGKRKDRSGVILRERLMAAGLEVAEYIVLPDERAKIQAQIEALCAAGIDLIATTGGTGMGPRDVTVEATRAVIEREVPGIAEAARSFGQRRTPYAMLSRALAGQRGQTLIVNFPGSSKGTEESLDALLPGMLHFFKMRATPSGGHGE